ncbi:MAG TPA: ABC transporter ATP-binding protein [Nitriliruptoraceae bacterium]|nr:ABC transporter ATP-binding protein [Nitriliruptoraceae bacterium]
MIRTRGLTKRYDDHLALDGVDLEVATGAVHGLLGPNGAGKTTLLGILAGLREPTSGSVEVTAERTRIAVLPDTPRFDPWLTGREVVDLARRLVDPTGPTEQVDDVLAQAGLADAADTAVGGYSRGMLQRLGVGCTVVGDPQLLLMDEPASALDPLGRREVLELTRRLRGSATVLVSSHILADVQDVCDSVTILDHGTLLFQGPLEELLVGSATPRVLVRCRPPLEPVVAALDACSWVQATSRSQPDEVAIEVTDIELAERHLAGVLSDASAHVISLAPEAVTLERAFLELTK